MSPQRIRAWDLMVSKALAARLSSGAITGYDILQTPNLSSVTDHKLTLTFQQAVISEKSVMDMSVDQ